MKKNYLDYKPEPKANAIVRLRPCPSCELDTAQEKRTGEVTGGYTYTYWSCLQCGNQQDIQPGDRPEGFEDYETGS